MKDKRIIFMGTPLIAKEVLATLIDHFNVVAVVTQPDKKVGRKKKLTASSVKELALSYKIPVIQPINIKDEYEEILNFKPDLIVTCAYGQILPKTLLDYPLYGAINAHASLLPKYRGGAPIERAIMNGDSKTGITIMYMTEEMDAGDIITYKETNIEITDNKETLTNKLATLASSLLKETIPKIFRKENDSIKQNINEVTYAPIIKKEEEFLDFNFDNHKVFNHARSLDPNPSVYAYLNGRRFKLYNAHLGNKKARAGEIVEISNGLEIACLNGSVCFTYLQEEGKNKILAKAYFKGRKKEDYIGKIFNEQNF